jgi:MFS family permease
MKKFSTREIAVCGCFLVSLGLVMSSFTTSLNQLIVTYSMFVGLGMGLLEPATFISISDYFTTRKSRAVALSMAGTGLGQMMGPQVVKFFLMKFGFRGTILLMGSLSLHGVIGACLFQPVEQNMKRCENDKEAESLTRNHPAPSTLNDTNKSDLSFWRKVERSMDLSLLKDPRFVILSFGIACAYTVTINFALILPFFLQVFAKISQSFDHLFFHQESAKLDTNQTATCMSVLAAFDLLSRLTFPYFTDRLRLSHRTTFIFGLVLLGAVRSVLAEQTNYISVLVTCVFFGYFRALSVVNASLTISEFCVKWYPEKLPGALGLTMIIKGVSVVTIGELLGWIRDLSSSYTTILHSQNILLSIVMIVWIVESTCYQKR